MAEPNSVNSVNVFQSKNANVKLPRLRGLQGVFQAIPDISSVYADNGTCVAVVLMTATTLTSWS